MRSPYVGRKAYGYDAKRKKQRKWHRENELVELMLTHSTGKILDVPCGTGRFFGLYEKLRRPYAGIDVSQDMIDVALKKYPRANVDVGSAFELVTHYKTIVCVRLLHLLDWPSAQTVLRQLCGAASESVILTVQLRDEARVTPDVHTHVHSRFVALVARLGWVIADDHKITSAGWHVMRLERK